jgi:serine/threonine protein kinase
MAGDLDDRTQAADVESLFGPPPVETPSMKGRRSNTGTGEASWPSFDDTALSGAEKEQALQPGTHIQHYELIRQLGSGGMGTVFLARDVRLGRRVAIKFLHTQDADLTKRFILEARATARCSHENIVIIYEVGEFSGSPFMVLEFLQGQPADEDDRRPAAAGGASGGAHGAGGARAGVRPRAGHRPPRPEAREHRRDGQGSIKVLDFGHRQGAPGRRAARGPPRPTVQPRLPNVADLGDDVANLTRSGSIMGTMAYMSPEQWGIGRPHRPPHGTSGPWASCSSG